MLLAALVAGCVTGTSPSRGGDAPAVAGRPNIVLLLSDDQRFDSLGCMGNRIVRTPHIDALASRGVIFDNAFCTTSICSISRASLLTGQYERRHGIDDFVKDLSPSQWQPTFPARLKQAGYRLGFIGKWGVGRNMPEQEYDFWRGFPGQGRYFTPGDDEHLTDKQARQALEFLDGCDGQRPFCLQISFKAAHCQDGAPWQGQFPPAPRYASLYADVAIPVPETANEVAFRLLPPFLQTSEARVRWGYRFANPEMYQYTVKNYYRLITGMDDAVGQIIERLKAKGLADHTVILFTSDNGFYLGEHGLAGKWFAHEESIRVPLWLYDPRLPDDLRGQRRKEVVLNIDLAPTILALAGLDIPEVMQGQSLSPLIHGQAERWRDDFLYEHRFTHAKIPRSEGVRTPHFKYVRYPDQQPVYEELFDLRADPGELRNLAGEHEHAATLRQLKARLEELIRAADGA
jgi:arylsulfatase A-like enzyme